MDAEYVKGLVEEAVVEGLTAAVKQSPEDAVDFLGRFLLNYADHMDKRSKAKIAAEVFSVQAEKDKEGAEAAQAAAQAAEASSPATLLAKAEEEVKAMLESAVELDYSAYTSLTNAVKKMVNASGCYVAEQMGTPSAEDDGTGVPSAKVKYIAASEGQEFVKDAVISDRTALTFKAWVMPAPAEEEPPAEEGAEPKPAAPAPELPVVYVADVLRENAIVYHGVPRPGAYVATPLQYGSMLHEGAIAGDHAPTNAEDGSLVVPSSAPTKQRSLALCVDSLGQNRDFSEAERGALKRVAAYLKAALERSEAALFAAEYAAIYGPKLSGASEEEAEAAALAAIEAANKASEEESSVATASAGEAAPADVLALIKANAALKAARAALDARAGALAALAGRRIPPREPVLKALQAAWFTLGVSKEALADGGALDTKALSWPHAKAHLGAEFVAKLKDTDATVAPAKALAYHKPESVRALLEGLDSAELDKTSPVLSVIVALTKAMLDVRDAAAAKAKREKEEEEARVKAEAEAAAAAAAAAGGEPPEE